MREVTQLVSVHLLDLGSVSPIVGDRGRLGQLVTNLVINAAHAVADADDDHEIAIITRTDGDDVVLAVEDSGPGIPEELFERVFEPYFTTKPSEVGTGLGLALVRKIAESHGGTARVSRSTRRGARVEVRLPRAQAASRAPQPASPLQSTIRVGTRKHRILIIDDEPMLLRALANAIGESHDVVTALGGQAGVELLANDRAFDLVLCDLQMPGVDCVAIYERLARSAPALLTRFVVMSGGAVTSRAAQFLEKLRPYKLDKPIDIDRVLAMAADPRAHA